MKSKYNTVKHFVLTEDTTVIAILRAESGLQDLFPKVEKAIIDHYDLDSFKTAESNYLFQNNGDSLDFVGFIKYKEDDNKNRLKFSLEEITVY